MSKRPACIGSLFLAAAAGAGRAQGEVVPTGGYRLREGDASLFAPASYAPCRCQVLYDYAALGIGALTAVRSLGLRRDASYPAPTQAHSLQLRVSCSQQGVPRAVQASTRSFAVNRGTDHTVVLATRAVHWPAVPVPGVPPAAFSVTLPLDQPVALVAGANLLLEFETQTSAGAPESWAWPADAVGAYPTGRHGTLANLGTGCPPQLQVAGNAPPVDGLTPHWFLAATGLTGRAVVALGITGSRDTDWAGVPLPHDLAGVGAPGCAAQVNGQLLAAVLSDPVTGEAWFDLGPLPLLPELQASVLFHQVYVADAAFNALGLRVSDRLRVQLGSFVPPLPALTLYSYGAMNLGDVPSAFRRAHLVLELQ